MAEELAYVKANKSDRAEIRERFASLGKPDRQRAK
jgi:hypothetical protein